MKDERMIDEAFTITEESFERIMEGIDFVDKDEFLVTFKANVFTEKDIDILLNIYNADSFLIYSDNADKRLFLDIEFEEQG